MALLVPNAGEEDALQAILNHTAATDCILRLFQSNTTPAETDVTATYTEATFTGYASATLTGASWTITPGAPSDGTYAQQTFTSSADQASQSIYGYFVTRTTTGIIAWAERFTDGPYNIANNGDNIKITPTITLD